MSSDLSFDVLKSFVDNLKAIAEKPEYKYNEIPHKYNLSNLVCNCGIKLRDMNNRICHYERTNEIIIR